MSTPKPKTLPTQPITSKPTRKNKTTQNGLTEQSKTAKRHTSMYDPDQLATVHHQQVKLKGYIPGLNNFITLILHYCTSAKNLPTTDKLDLLPDEWRYSEYSHPNNGHAKLLSLVLLALIRIDYFQPKSSRGDEEQRQHLLRDITEYAVKQIASTKRLQFWYIGENSRIASTIHQMRTNNGWLDTKTILRKDPLEVKLLNTGSKNWRLQDLLIADEIRPILDKAKTNLTQSCETCQSCQSENISEDLNDFFKGRLQKLKTGKLFGNAEKPYAHNKNDVAIYYLIDNWLTEAISNAERTCSIRPKLIDLQAELNREIITESPGTKLLLEINNSVSNMDDEPDPLLGNPTNENEEEGAITQLSF